MSDLPQKSTPPRATSATPRTIAERLKKEPGKAVIPFLPAYLYELPDSALLLPQEVASLFRVNSKTVSRWALSPNKPLVRYTTPGGHLRLRCENVREVYERTNSKVQIQG